MRFAVALVLITACGTPDKEDYTKEKPVEPSSGPAPTVKEKPVAKKALGPDELGTCHLTASGAVTADQTTKVARRRPTSRTGTRPRSRRR